MTTLPDEFVEDSGCICLISADGAVCEVIPDGPAVPVDALFDDNLPFA